jgi:putative transposase
LRRTLAPEGLTPRLSVPAGHRHRLSVIAALSVSPIRQHFGLYFRTQPDGYFKNTDVADFLRDLLRHLRGRVIVVWDNGSMHRGPAIRDVLKAHPRLSIEHLPPYAPEFNPVEQLWNHLKYGQLANYVAPDIATLTEKVTTFLTNAKTDTAHLENCYKHTPLYNHLTGPPKPEGQ